MYRIGAAKPGWSGGTHPISAFLYRASYCSPFSGLFVLSSERYFVDALTGSG